MRRSILLFYVVIVILQWGCTTEFDEKAKSSIMVGLVQGPNPIGDGCTVEYNIEFSDLSSDSTQLYCYWPAVVKLENSEFLLVSFSAGAPLLPPFSYEQRTVNLSWNDNFSPQDELYAVVVKADNCDNVGNFGYRIASDVSNFPIPFSGFPPDCYPFTIALKVNDNDIAQGECVYIDETPTMPEMVARIEIGSPDGWPEWSLSVDYTRSGRDDHTVFTPPSNPGQTWNINWDIGSDIRGGRAVLRCEDSYNPGVSSEFLFWIRARNPFVQTIKNYIAVLPGNMWYWVWVANSESIPQEGRSYLQFNEIPVNEVCGSMDNILHTPNASNDGGFGIYQLTYFDDPARPPNAQELWNWQENVNSGTAWLAVKQIDADSWMGYQRIQSLIQMEEVVPVPIMTEGEVTFRENSDTTIEHAVALKRYNGLGLELRNYCEWDAELESWGFYRVASYVDEDGVTHQHNYVYRVCSSVP